jgi:NitT/TauT family transport system permease protein
VTISPVETQTLPQRGVVGLSRKMRWLAERCFVPLCLLALWQVAATVIGPVAVASPADTVAGIGDGLKRGWLVPAFMLTLQAAVVGYAISATVGIVAGCWLGRSPFWGRVFEDPILWVYSIPKVVLYPIVVLVFGLGLKSNIAFAIIQGVFAPLLIIYAAVRQLPPVYIRTARIYQLSSSTFFFRIIVPHATPAIVMALRYAFSLSYTGVVIAQMFAADEGAGYELVKAISLHQIPKTFAIVTIMMAIALAVNILLYLLERWVRTHRPAAAQRWSGW